jgi:hypothetical protein
MQISDDAYRKHHVFTELERYSGFYKSLSMSVFSFLSMGTKAVCNIDTYVYSSVQGTLESIKAVLLAGRINDAYALLRKYYDSAVINIYSNLYLNEHFSIDNFVVATINDWLQGTKPLPRYPAMVKYIRESPTLNLINAVLLGDSRYKAIRDRCDDHVHYNFFQYVMLNDNEVYIKSRERWLDQFADDTRNLFILHVGYILFVNDHYMMSSDYMDALDCEMTPTEDSQHWVAPFIQDVFDEIITPARPDVTSVIKTNSAMYLS